MTCDRARELLPWLLNETLEDGERQEVLAHVRGCEACRRALAETRFALAAAGAHLPSEALVAVAFDEPVPGLDPAVVEEHLAACPQCAADLELARTSRALADETVALLPRRKAAPAPRRAAGWQAAAVAASLVALVAAGGWLHTRQQVERLEARGTTATPGPRQAPPAASTDPSRIARLEAELRDLAAQRAAAERTARQEAETLREQLARAEAASAAGGGPQVNTVIAELASPGDVVRGSEREPVRIDLPTSASGVTLVLRPADGRGLPSFRDYAAELVDAAGRRVLTADGLVLQEEPLPAFILHLPRQRLRPGAYTLELYGISASRREKVETYTFRIE